MFVKFKLAEEGYAFVQTFDVMSFFACPAVHPKLQKEVTRVEVNYRSGKYQSFYVDEPVEEVATKFAKAEIVTAR